MKRMLLCEVWRVPIDGRNQPRWFVGFVLISADLLSMPFQKAEGFMVRAVGIRGSGKSTK